MLLHIMQISFDCGCKTAIGTPLASGYDWNQTGVWYLLETGRNWICTIWSNFNYFTQTRGHRDSHILSEWQCRVEIISSPQHIKLMTIMKDLVVSTYTFSSVSRHWPVCVCVSGVCLLMCIWTECTVNPFKYLLIRPSTPSPLSRSVLFHSTPNYFNPLIAQRAPGPRVCRDRYCWGDECVCKCGHISRHWGLITGPSAPRALQLWPAVGSTGVTPPKIRCQGIFYTLVSIPTRPPDSVTRTPWWIRRRYDLFTKTVHLKCGDLNIKLPLFQNKPQCYHSRRQKSSSIMIEKDIFTDIIQQLHHTFIRICLYNEIQWIIPFWSIMAML